MSKKLFLALGAAASLSLGAGQKALSQDGVGSTQEALVDNMSSHTDIQKTHEKGYMPRYIPTTESFLRTIVKANGEDFANMPIFTYDSLVKGVGPVDTLTHESFMCYGYKDKKNNIYYRYNPQYFAQVQKQIDTTKDTIKQDVEQQQETFCGVAVGQLTDTQKELYDKLTPVEREQLSQKITINKNKGEIEFSDIKLAIKDADGDPITKEEADELIKKLGEGWRMPRDVDYTQDNQLKLDPIHSDYDAMIIQMPGTTEDKKMDNFRLLTGMILNYWTSQRYSSFVSGVSDRQKILFVNRTFFIGGGGSHREFINPDDSHISIRPVKNIL